MAKPNYKQIYAMKAKREQQILDYNPNTPRSSGIYIFTRVDEHGIKYCYVGQAVKLLERLASHLGEYDRIGLSLKKRGLHSKENPYGWNIVVHTCDTDKLDSSERYFIKSFADDGYQLYNRTIGGQDSGKATIGEGKSTKGYRQGVLQGRKSLAKELSHIINTHLVISLKKPSKVSEKALEKFNTLLDEATYKEE